jgi:hypothetical protein
MSEITIENSTERDELKELLDSVPDHLRDDHVALIFHCKYSYRDRLKSLNAAQQQNVASELKRVENLRSSFTTHVENARLVQSIKFSRMAWRSHAKARCHGEMTRIKKFLDKDKSEPNDRHRRDLKTLQEVGTWTAIIDPIHSNTPVKDDEYYSTTYEITLRRNLGTLSYNTYDLDKYPLHEVLYKKENNPQSTYGAMQEKYNSILLFSGKHVAYRPGITWNHLETPGSNSVFVRLTNNLYVI